MKHERMISFSNHKSDLARNRAINGILYLAPHEIAGRSTVCASSSPGCRSACLYSAGRGSFDNVKSARIRKTLQWFDDRAGLIADIERDIKNAVARGKRESLPVYIRLNGTSDLPGLYASLARFDGVGFYEYTKHPRRAYKRAIASHGVDLTFSLDERDRWDVARDYLDNGHRVAVCFDLKKSEAMPTTWRGFPVVDGDNSDLRPLDPPSVIIGLRPKGKARRDDSGFIFSSNG